MEAGVYVCIGLTGPPTTITSGAPVPAAPSPTQVGRLTFMAMRILDADSDRQTGMVSGCVRFYNVESGDGCYAIAQDAGIPLK